MRINPNSGTPAVTSLPATAPTKAPKPVVGQDQVAFAGTDKMTRALAQIPLIRADKVAMAKNLVKDPAYPSEAVLEKVSNLLARNIKDVA